MTLPSAKEIAALAKACRKAGITQFKGAGIEFTLGEAVPPKSTKKILHEAPSASNTIIEDDSPSHEDLLFWSIPSPEITAGKTENEN